MIFVWAKVFSCTPYRMNYEQQILHKKWCDERWRDHSDGRKVRTALFKKLSSAKESFDIIKKSEVKSYVYQRQETIYNNKKKRVANLNNKMEEEIRLIRLKYEAERKRLIEAVSEAKEILDKIGKTKSSEYTRAERIYSDILKDWINGKWESPYEKELRERIEESERVEETRRTQEEEQSRREKEDAEEDVGENALISIDSSIPKDIPEGGSLEDSKTFSEFENQTEEKTSLHKKNFKNVCGEENPSQPASLPENYLDSKQSIDLSPIVKDYLENGWKAPVCPEEAELISLRDQNEFKHSSIPHDVLIDFSKKKYSMEKFKPSQEIDQSWCEPSPFSDYVPPSLQHIFNSNPSSLPVIKKKPRSIYGFEKNLREQQIGPSVNLYKREIILGDD